MAPKLGLCPCILCSSLGYQRCLQFAHLFVPYYLKTKPKHRCRHHYQQQNRSFQIRKFSTRPKQNNNKQKNKQNIEDDDRGPDDFLLDRVFFLSFSACYDLDMQVHMLDITSTHVWTVCSQLVLFWEVVESPGGLTRVVKVGLCRENLNLSNPDPHFWSCLLFLFSWRVRA